MKMATRVFRHVDLMQFLPGLGRLFLCNPKLLGLHGRIVQSINRPIDRPVPFPLSASPGLAGRPAAGPPPLPTREARLKREGKLSSYGMKGHQSQPND